MFLLRKPVSEISLVVICSVYITALLNQQFFMHVMQAYSAAGEAWLAVLRVGGFHFGLLLLLLLFLGSGRLLKGLLATVIVFSASTAYFIDTYNVIIDADMIDNTLKTDQAEALDLLSFMQFFYILVLGALPAWLVWRQPVKASSLTHLLLHRVVSIAVIPGLLAVSVFSSADFYASYFREAKVLRYYSNPLAPVYGLYRYTEKNYLNPIPTELQIVAPDAQRLVSNASKPMLTVLVVGETVRAGNWGLNGYERNTTPRLAAESGIINFTNVTSCGTSTAHSLPCMFSHLGRKEFNKNTAKYSENVLDILHKTGVNIVWFDNNSSSKGVADRLTYIDSKSSANNPQCDSECRDTGMIEQSAQWLEQQAAGDKLIVLHQMGSHGPAYFKRYKPEFEVFKETCQSNQLDSCTQQSIINAYDNTIVYTDHFLGETIDWLKTLQDDYLVSMIYISDHGESLGENGLYLHGYPFAFAPKEQIEVPMVTWLGDEQSNLDIAAIKSNADKPWDHDALFHSLLGAYGVTSTIYNPKLNFLK